MIKLIHVTDPHLTVPGTDLFGLDPHERLDACLSHVEAQHGDADLLVISGDLTHDGEPPAYEALARRLEQTSAPWRVLMGNHDDRSAFFAAFPNYTVRQGFVQEVVEVGATRVILLDTLQDGRTEGELCPERGEWLDRALVEAGERPVFIFMHHPPFAIHLPALDRIGLGLSEAFHARLKRHGNVRHIFAGHVHRQTSGSWRGIGFNTLSGTSHQAAAIFNEDRFVTTLEPAAYGVILIDQDNVVVHTVHFLHDAEAIRS